MMKMCGGALANAGCVRGDGVVVHGVEKNGHWLTLKSHEATLANQEDDRWKHD